MQTRYLTTHIARLAFDRHKMAFVSGPRQSGKTTLAKMLGSKRSSTVYGNWDQLEFRRVWSKTPQQLVSSLHNKLKPLLILDEIHKARRWKSTLKGLYDSLDSPCDILVTGSARLNVYKRGGDSLLGRYINFRLHPFSLGEVLRKGGKTPSSSESMQMLHSFSNQNIKAKTKIFDRLISFSGFPEPFIASQSDLHRIWQQGRTEKIVREDLRDLSRIQELSQVESLMALLPERVGSPLSIQSLREDLEVAHQTVKVWLAYLKELYYLFELKPYTAGIARSLKKEGKIYLWDWSEVPSPGARFENLIAAHLLKACDYWNDIGDGKFDLYYLRNKQKQELDFLITKNRLPWLVAEAKLSDESISSSYPSLLKKLLPEMVVQVLQQEIPPRKHVRAQHTIHILSASTFLSCLP